MAASDATPSCSPFEQLTAPLLQKVLACVPQRERLTQCALVSSAWAEACVVASTHIECKLRDSAHAAELVAWLGKHGRHVRSLVVHSAIYYEHLQLQLPWGQLGKLQTLSLDYITLPAIQQPAGSSSASTVPLLPQLKEACLHSCRLHSANCLLQLASSPHLTSLKFCCFGVGSWWRQHSAAEREQAGQDLCDLLQHLRQRQQQQHQRLLELHLSGLPATCALLPHIAGLQHLQSLDLTMASSSANSYVASFPPSLTQLYLVEHSEPQVALPLRLQQLSSLQSIVLFGCALRPSGLGSMPQLQSIYLNGCSLLPDGQASGAVALLQALHKPTRLQCLCLNGMPLLSEQAQLYSALTASSQLTALDIVSTSNEQPLSPGAVRHAFPAGRQLPHLQELSIALDYDGVSEQDGWCVDSDDLTRIASACPSLYQLNISGVVREGADVSGLLRLPKSCGHLRIAGNAFGDAAAAVVMQLSQLTYLMWHTSQGFSDLGLLRLTALRGLEELTVYEAGSMSAGLCADPDCFELNLNSSEKGPVWLQLKKVCCKSPACLEEFAKQWVAESESQVEVGRLQQQLADRDAQLADREAEVLRLQHALAELRGGS